MLAFPIAFHQQTLLLRVRQPTSRGGRRFVWAEEDVQNRTAIISLGQTFTGKHRPSHKNHTLSMLIHLCLSLLFCTKIEVILLAHRMILKPRPSTYIQCSWVLWYPPRGHNVRLRWRPPALHILGLQHRMRTQACDMGWYMTRVRRKHERDIEDSYTTTAGSIYTRAPVKKLASTKWQARKWALPTHSLKKWRSVHT